MGKMESNKINFEYTEEFIKKSKFSIKRNWGIAFLWVLLLAFVMCNFKGLFFLPLLIIVSALIWLFGFSNVNRKYENDRIYVEDNLIHFDKYYSYRNGGGYRSETAKNIRKVTVTKYSIIIYGNIISTKFGRTRKHKKIKIPNGIENSEEFIGYLKTRQKGVDEVTLHEKTDEAPKDKSISRKDVWKCIRNPFLRLSKRYVPLSLILIIIALVCVYVYFYMKIDIVYIMIIGIAAMVVGCVSLLFYIINVMKDYIPDLIFKSIRVYRGYLDRIEMISGLNQTPYFIKQYNDFYSITLVYKKGYESPRVAEAIGNLKSNPIGGRRFLIKDKWAFENINRNKEIEVMYLKHSKLIIGVNKEI